jgi:hypothetical protein
LRIIARLSARTFLPEPLCYNEDWLRISVDYTIDFFTGAYVLRLLPPVFRPLVHWFLPMTKKLREDVAIATRILEPEVIARKKEREADIKAGKPPKKYVDAFAWMEAVSTKSGDFVNLVYGYEFPCPIFRVANADGDALQPAKLLSWSRSYH